MKRTNLSYVDITATLTELPTDSPSKKGLISLRTKDNKLVARGGFFYDSLRKGLCLGPAEAQFYVNPKYKLKNATNRLVEKILSIIKLEYGYSPEFMYAETLANNVPAKRLLTQIGFECVDNKSRMNLYVKPLS